MLEKFVHHLADLLKQKKDGTKRERRPDGWVWISNPDGSMSFLDPGGTQYDILTFSVADEASAGAAAEAITDVMINRGPQSN